MQCHCCRASQAVYFCHSCVQRGVDQQRTLKAQLSDQIKVATRRCAVQEQAAARWRVLRAEVAMQEARVAALRLVALPVPSKPRTFNKVPRPIIRLDHVRRQQRLVDQRIIAARQVLVREASAIMGMERQSIAGLSLPHPREMKLQNAVRINAALQHTCHLLSLLTRYLFIALPFEPSGTKLLPNLPFVGTTKFRDKNPLSLTRKHQRAFYTSYALLSHSIAYLAWTQGVEEEDLAANLYGLVESATLGKRSHLTMKSLGFSLDVNDVVQQVLEDGLEEEGWAIVNA